MSKQDPTNVVVRTDEGIASDSIGILRSVQPLLKALSADNVNPLAVVQLESLGACFVINGDFARQVSDHLVRSSSVRMGRISQLVGWMAGDTASAMSLTAGGRAVSILSLLVFELYDETAGELFFELSVALLPTQQNN